MKYTSKTLTILVLASAVIFLFPTQKENEVIEEPEITEIKQDTIEGIENSIPQDLKQTFHEILNSNDPDMLNMNTKQKYLYARIRVIHMDK